MKKIILTFVLLIVASCDIKFKETKAETGPIRNPSNYEHPYSFQEVYGYEEKEIEGMIYGTWYVKFNHSHTGYSIHTQNITKDLLEVQKLRLEISKMVKENEKRK